MVVRVHKDLVTPGVGIHKAKKDVACCGIDKLVDSRKREAILRIGMIEVGVVYTHAPTFPWFADHYHICHIRGIVHLLGETDA